MYNDKASVYKTRNIISLIGWRFYIRQNIFKIYLLCFVDGFKSFKRNFLHSFYLIYISHRTFQSVLQMKVFHVKVKSIKIVSSRYSLTRVCSIFHVVIPRMREIGDLETGLQCIQYRKKGLVIDKERYPILRFFVFTCSRSSIPKNIFYSII